MKLIWQKKVIFYCNFGVYSTIFEFLEPFASIQEKCKFAKNLKSPFLHSAYKTTPVQLFPLPFAKVLFLTCFSKKCVSAQKNTTDYYRGHVLDRKDGE